MALDEKYKKTIRATISFRSFMLLVESIKFCPPFVLLIELKQDVCLTHYDNHVVKAGLYSIDLLDIPEEYERICIEDFPLTVPCYKIYPPHLTPKEANKIYNSPGERITYENLDQTQAEHTAITSTPYLVKDQKITIKELICCELIESTKLVLDKIKYNKQKKKLFQDELEYLNEILLAPPIEEFDKQPKL